MLDAAMSEPETTKVAGLSLRKISIGSCAILARLNSPFADLEKIATGETKYTFSDVSEFVFVHAAPWEKVRELVYAAPRAALAQAADELLSNCSPAELSDIMAAITTDAQAIRAAQADAVPDPNLPPSKNVRRPRA